MGDTLYHSIMKTVKWLILGVAVLLLLFLTITFFLPRTYSVERTATIKAPADVIFGQVSDLEAWQEWNPWNSLDPDIEVSYGDIRQGTGASYRWTSEIAGNGEMRILESVPSTEVHYELRFQGYEHVPSHSTIRIDLLSTENEGPVHEVTWTFEGEVGDQFFARWMSVLMDGFVGDAYEDGLASLKARSEEMAAQGVAAVPVP
jgi:hypothetical protein